jgi:hypothetical protein
MREDGFSFDKLLLTTDGNFIPSGVGPEESPQGNQQPQDCVDVSDCDDGNDCTADSCVEGVCSNDAVSDGTLCDDDSNECTEDVCVAGTCSHLDNSEPCSDDGDSCTDDVCSGGSCSHPDNGTCEPTGPCSAYCSTPVLFSGNFQSGSLGTAATCHESSGPLNGGVCGNFANGRTLSVNGQVMNCNNGNWGSLPPTENGGYCVTTTAGQHPWAYFATW